MDSHHVKIIEFISKNPGCNKEKVVNGTGDLSRVPTLHRLDELIKMNVIRTDAIKAKFHNKLYVSQDDLVSLTLKQFNDFERYYFKLLDKVIRLTNKSNSRIWKIFKEKYGHIPSSTELQDLLYNTIILFQMMMSSFLLRSVFVWPPKVSDKNYLVYLNGMVYQRITDIYLAMQDKLKTAKIDNIEELLEKVLKGFYSDEEKNIFPDPFEEFGLFDDLKKVGYTQVLMTQ